LDETKEPTIDDHIAKAKELTIPQVSVREEAFTELVKAVERMNEEKAAMRRWLNKIIEDHYDDTPDPEPTDEEE